MVVQWSRILIASGTVLQQYVTITKDMTFYSALDSVFYAGASWFGWYGNTTHVSYDFEFNSVGSSTVSVSINSFITNTITTTQDCYVLGIRIGC